MQSAGDSLLLIYPNLLRSLHWSVWGCSFNLPAPHLTPRATCSTTLPLSRISSALLSLRKTPAGLSGACLEGAATGQGHVPGNKRSLVAIASQLTHPWRLNHPFFCPQSTSLLDLWIRMKKFALRGETAASVYAVTGQQVDKRQRSCCGSRRVKTRGDGKSINR